MFTEISKCLFFVYETGYVLPACADASYVLIGQSLDESGFRMLSGPCIAKRSRFAFTEAVQLTILSLSDCEILSTRHIDYLKRQDR